MNTKFKINLQRHATGQTKLAAMVNPQVLADMVSAQLANAIRFSPLATVDNTLVGTPGSTLTLPSWNYIGAATDIEEGVAIPLDLMTSSTTPVTVKKAGKGVEITDEAMLSGYGDPVGEAGKQITMSIAEKVDADLLAAALTTTQTVAAIPKGGKLTVEGLQTGLDIFNDEDDAPVILIANPKDAADLRMDAAKNYVLGSDVGANALVNGTYADVLGVQVVRSRNVDVGAPVLIKQGAIALIMKRGVEAETDRDIVKKTTVITADEHYAAYLYDLTKVVKITTATA